MTNKDMNLNLSPEHRLRAVGGRPQLSVRLAGDVAPQAEPEEGARAKPTVTAASSKADRQSPLLALVFVIALSNLFLMAAAGYWLHSGFDELRLPWEAPRQAAAPVMEQAFEVLDRDVRALQAGLEQSQLAVSEQQRLIATALLDIDEKLAALEVQRAVVEEPAESLEEVAAPDAWVINVGTFPEPEKARLLVEQLMGLGYESRVVPADSGEQMGHRVQVTGFGERAAAEQAARQIMGQTELNGLWVWKDE